MKQEKSRWRDKAGPGWGLALALVLGVGGAGGLGWPDLYALESPSWAAQGLGQDAVDLFVVTPLLVWVSWGAFRGGRFFRAALGGFFLYAAYGFLLYAFCVSFNRLFLVYCAGLGLSAYGLGGWALGSAREGPGPSRPIRWAGYSLIGAAALTALLWLAQDLPAVLGGWTPQGVRESGLATNPVHVLDLALVLPGMAWTGTALLRGKGWAYRFFPSWMVFIILMAWALAGMAAALWARGLAAGLAPALIFLAVSAVGSAVLAVYWRKFTALA